MSATFGLLISLQFLSNPCFVYRKSWFYDNLFIFVFHCFINLCGRVPVSCIWYIVNHSARTMHGQGGSEIPHWWQKNCVSVRTKLFWRAIYPPSRGPIPGPSQDTGKASSKDHMVVQPRDRECDPDVDPTTYVWNMFLNFFHHELTQSCKCD